MPSSRRWARRAARSAGLPAALFAAVPGAGAIEPLPPGAASCAGCHAAQAMPGAPPPLSGLSPDEIAAALAGYREGSRVGTIMPRIAGGFPEPEARAIAQALGRPAKDAK